MKAVKDIVGGVRYIPPGKSAAVLDVEDRWWEGFRQGVPDSPSEALFGVEARLRDILGGGA